MCSAPTINANGVITFTSGCYYCFSIVATNACGTTSQFLTSCD